MPFWSARRDTANRLLAGDEIRKGQRKPDGNALMQKKYYKKVGFSFGVLFLFVYLCGMFFSPLPAQ